MIPVVAISAWSGTGKTTLLKKLIPALCARGIRPGLIKHTHHNMDVDRPGKDSYALRKAGAAQTMVASTQRWALMTETPDEAPLDLAYLVSRMDHATLDLVLVALVIWLFSLQNHLMQMFGRLVVELINHCFQNSVQHLSITQQHLPMTLLLQALRVKVLTLFTTLWVVQYSKLHFP